MITLWIFFFVVFIIWILVSRWRRRHVNKLAGQLGNDVKCLPVIGHAYKAIGSDEDRMKNIQLFGREANKHGGMSYVWLGNVFILMVSDIEVVDIICKRCLEKHYVVQFMKPALGNGTVIAPVPIWKPRRKVVIGAFHRKNLTKFVNTVFSRQSDITVEKLREVEGKGSFAIWKYINTYTLDSVCETMLGVQINTQCNPNNEFFKSFAESSHLVAARMVQPWLYYQALYELTPQFRTMTKNSKVLNDFVDKIIQSKSKELNMKRQKVDRANDTNGFDKDTLKTLLEIIMASEEGEKPLTDLECREEMLLLTLAATDTSALGASFTLVMLSRYPDIQEKVYKELQEVLGGSDRSITAKDLPHLPYLDAVIRETIRLYPPIPIIMRNIDEDILLPSGITLPKGIGACIHIWAINRNPKYWGEDADSFRPERFLDAQLKHSTAFISFSLGPRNCPGKTYGMMSMKALVTAVLRKYQLLPAASANGSNSSCHSGSKDDAIRLQYSIMMRAVDDFKLQIKSRVSNL